MKRQQSIVTDVKNPKKKKKYLTEAELSDITSMFLSNKKHANVLIDLLDQLQNPKKTPAACVSAVEKIFLEVLTRKDMVVNDSERNGNEADSQYKTWLNECYEDAWQKMSLCLQVGTLQTRLQALNSMFALLSTEAKYLVKKKKRKNKTTFHVHRLKEILHSISLTTELHDDILKKLCEFLAYKDVNCNIWLALDSLLKEKYKQQPADRSLWNILLVLSRLPKLKNSSTATLCNLKKGVPEDRAVRAAVDSVWKQLAPWQFSSRTHQLLLVVLVEHMMSQMDNAVFLTDYFMDALDRDECEINMLALQGIFNLVIKHNIEYPDIFGKLYQLYGVSALKAKYKTRLFALTDEFLKSTHLPMALVAAFAKRFSRLLLAASPPDLLILMTFMANLLIRHPDLKFLCHNPNGKQVDDDPYLEDEKDPLKSRASESQLWEVKLMQHHINDRVAKMATFINNDLPLVEYQLEPLLDLQWDHMMKKDIKLLKKKIAQLSENKEKDKNRPLPSKLDEARKKQVELFFSDFNKLFTSQTS